MTSVRVFLLGPLLVFGIFSGSFSQAKVPGFVKKMAKNYVCEQIREFCRDVCYSHGLALSPFGIALNPFDMDRFDQQSEADQVVMMDQFISQLGITDDFIAWHLRLYKSTVVAVEKECGGKNRAMAERLATRVRRINFFRNNWGKMLVGAGVGVVAVTVILLNNTQLR